MSDSYTVSVRFSDKGQKFFDLVSGIFPEQHRFDHDLESIGFLLSALSDAPSMDGRDTEWWDLKKRALETMAKLWTGGNLYEEGCSRSNSIDFAIDDGASFDLTFTENACLNLKVKKMSDDAFEYLVKWTTGKKENATRFVSQLQTMGYKGRVNATVVSTASLGADGAMNFLQGK